MANRRELKKQVNDIMGVLFAECMATKLYVKNADAAQADEILIEILGARQDFICRINHTEPGSVKLFYKKLNIDLDNKIEAICDAIDKLGSVNQ